MISGSGFPHSSGLVSQGAYTIEKSNGTAEQFDLCDVGFLQSKSLPHSVTFTDDYIVTWEMDQSDYRSGFKIRQIGAKSNPISFSISNLAESNQHFYAIRHVTKNILSISFVEADGSARSTKRSKTFREFSPVSPHECDLTTTFVKVEIFDENVKVSYLGNVRGWLLESSENFAILAEKAKFGNDENSHPIRIRVNSDPRRRDLAILPVFMENVLIYRFAGEKLEFQTKISEITTRAILNRNLTLFEFTTM